MLIDRTHKPWFVVSAVILAAAGLAYWALSSTIPHGVTGGSVAGLLFGIAGSAMMVFAALLAVRKRLPTWRVGSAQWWLRGHLWLGTLGFVLILFHSGFGWGGLLENLLWISFGLVVVTGFAGVALQHVIPRLLTTRVPLETMVAQIPFLSQTNLFRADQLVAKQTGPLDIPFEPLKPFAEEVLKQQRVLKRESDFPKELAKVYANVPQPEAEAKKAHVAADQMAGAARPSPLAQMKAAAQPTQTAPPASPAADATVPSPDAVPTATPKSPLELMREKAAAAKAGSEAASTNLDQPAATAAAQPAKLSPLEIMKAKAAAKKTESVSQDAAASAPSTSHATQNAAANASHGVTSPPDSPSSSKPKSPLEMMQAKLVAQKTASADKSAETPKPLTVEKPSAAIPDAGAKLSPLEIMKAKLAAKNAGDVAAQSASASADPTTSHAAQNSEENASHGVTSPTETPTKLSPLELMKAKGAPAAKPPAVTKPTPPVAVAAPPKSKAVIVIPSAALAELRNFHLRAVRPFLADGKAIASGLDEVLASRRLFGQLKSDLPSELHEALDRLEAWCEERRQFNTQLRLHRWLHWWLIFHIPPSIALLVLFVAHVVVSLRVVPWTK